MNAKYLILIALFGTIACKSPEPKPDEKVVEPGPAASEQEGAVEESPTRIIFFLGDGMGAGAVTAGAYAKGEPLEMMTMPHLSWMRTHEHEYVTTDSGASATALATGNKTHFEGISVKPGTTKAQETDPETHLKSILDVAEARGWKTGLVATSRINHATPAAYASNRANRGDYEDIALDMSTSGVDVLLGAGSDFFEKRKDGRDLMKGFADQGYRVARSADEVAAAAPEAERLVGLMHPRDMPYVIDGGRAMSLAQMTRSAIEVLDNNNDEGWFLMVEGSFIDWCEHDLASSCTVAEMLDFDAAVGEGLAYARDRDDTLVVATSDHETGGLSVLDPHYVGRFAEVFGGEDEAIEAAAPSGLKTPMEIERVPAHFAIGGGWKLQQATVERPSDVVFELSDLEDWRYSISFGHLGVQSRAMLKEGEQRDFSGPHTATHVPLFAEGSGAAFVAESRDNAVLGERLLRLVESPSVAATVPQPDEAPKNVIVLIGDGLGMNPVTAAYYANGGLFMLDAPVHGISSTHSVDAVVNDSAASATAIAAGLRSRRGAVGMVAGDGGLVSAPSLLEGAEASGRKTGLVTTTQLTHATPAAFYAHVETRGETETIADHFINLAQRIPGADGVDVAVGGGLAEFTDAQKTALEATGYDVRTTWDPTLATSRTVSLLAQQGMPSARIRHRDGRDDTPTLADMTTFAMESLQKQSGDDGFFLMVEGGQIDWLMHGLVDDATLIDEIVDFDQAVAAVVEWAEKRGDTLVIVTADHDHTLSVLDNHYSFHEPVNCRAAKECGGTHDYPAIEVKTDGVERGEGLDDKALQGEEYSPPSLRLQYGWIIKEANERKRVAGPHSANFVPIFAWGPGAENFGGFVDQPEIGRRIWKVSGYQRPESK